MVLRAHSRPVFISCTGRSGSTLLLRYVNTVRNVTVWGEHAGILTELMNLRDRLVSPRIRQMIDSQRPTAQLLINKQVAVQDNTGWTAEWANSFDQEDLDQGLRQFMERLFAAGLPAERRWGFKEIRYRDPESAFLRQMYPASKTILLARDPEMILRSQLRHFAKQDAGQLTGLLAGIAEYYEFAGRLLADDDRDTVHVSRYVDLASDGVEEARRLARFLGEQLDEALALTIAEERASDAADAEVALEPEALDQRLLAYAESLDTHVPAELLERCLTAYLEVVRTKHLVEA